MKIEKELPGVKKNVLLKNYTTFKIGGPTKYFFVAKNKKDLIQAILMAKKNKLPFFILAGGSNLLIADEGYKGLIINFQFSIFNFQKNEVIVGAGLSLGKIVSAAIKRNLTGLEWAAGVPGTAGGAIYGNAGAFGKSMEDIVKSVEVFDLEDLRFKIYDLRKCQFSYRNSVFKKNPNLIILSAVLQLKKGNKKRMKRKINEYLNYRKKTQPLSFPSAGSIFKNPSPDQISKKFAAGKGFSAGELIERCGLKGKRIGKIKISEKHANFIVNLGEGKAKDVKKLIKLIKNRVKNKFGIELEEEICHLGF